MLTFCDVNQNNSNMGPDRTILPQALQQTSSQHGVVNVKINSPPVKSTAATWLCYFLKRLPHLFLQTMKEKLFLIAKGQNSSCIYENLKLIFLFVCFYIHAPHSNFIHYLILHVWFSYL